jgi:hypothetical protein
MAGCFPPVTAGSHDRRPYPRHWPRDDSRTHSAFPPCATAPRGLATSNRPLDSLRQLRDRRVRAYRRLGALRVWGCTYVPSGLHTPRRADGLPAGSPSQRSWPPERSVHRSSASGRRKRYRHTRSRLIPAACRDRHVGVWAEALEPGRAPPGRRRGGRRPELAPRLRLVGSAWGEGWISGPARPPDALPGWSGQAFAVLARRRERVPPWPDSLLSLSGDAP